MSKIIYSQYNNSFPNNQVNLKNVVSAHFFKQNTTNYIDYIPTYYILSLTRAERRIFAYLLRFRPRGQFTQYINEIAQAANTCRNTVKRATNKFHNDGVISKFQQQSCFDVNLFTIENKNIFDLDKRYSKKMSHINININKYYINTLTHTNTILNTNTITCARARVRVGENYKKETKMAINKDLFTKHKISLTAHGEIYFSHMPQGAIEFALGKIKDKSGIKDIGRLISYYVREYAKANKLSIDYGGYFRALEGSGIDKNSEIAVFDVVNKSVSVVSLEKKCEILKDVGVDPDKDVKEKLSRVQKMISIGKLKIKGLEAIKQERLLTPFEEAELQFEEGHLNQRKLMEVKYRNMIDQNQVLRNESAKSDTRQAERDYRSLYLKIERDSYELNNWKKMLDNIESITPAFREETKKIANIKIPQYTKSIALDLEKLQKLENELMNNKTSAPLSDSDNFLIEDEGVQGGIH